MYRLQMEEPGAKVGDFLKRKSPYSWTMRLLTGFKFRDMINNNPPDVFVC